MIETIQSGLTAAALFMCAVLIVSLVAFSAAPLVRDAWRKWRKRGSAAVAIGGIAIATIYGGGKPHVVPHAGADAGIALLAIEAEYTNEVTVVEVKYTAGDVTTATPVSVRNAESEQWRELEKVGATITPGQTNVLAFTVAEDVAAYRYWWVGVDLPAVIVENQGITITNFVATSKSVRIDWTCDDPKATVFAVQRRRKTNTSQSYAQNGLVIFWDGLENAGWGIHDENATTWTDLTGNGYDMPLNANAIIMSNGVKVKSHVTTKGGVGMVDYSGSQDALMFDVCITWGSNSTDSRCIIANGAIANNSSRATICAKQSKYFEWGYQFRNDVVVFAYGRTLTLVAGYGKGYVNAERFVANASDRWGFTNGKIAVGGDPRDNNYACSDSTIHSVRVYNRELTAEEIENNNLVDKARFSGVRDWQTVGTTTSNSFQYDGFTVGEDWEWRVTSTYTEGDE